MSSQPNEQRKKETPRYMHPHSRGTQIPFDPPPANYDLMRLPQGCPDPDGMHPTDSDDNDYPRRDVPDPFGTEYAKQFLNDGMLPWDQMDDQSGNPNDDGSGMQTLNRPMTDNIPFESSFSDVPAVLALDGTHQDQQDSSQDTHDPCFVSDNPFNAKDIFCHQGPQGELRDDFTTTRLINGNTEFITAFLKRTLGPPVTYGTAGDTSTTPWNAPVSSPKHVVEVRRDMSSLSDEIDIFHCVSDEEARLGTMVGFERRRSESRSEAQYSGYCVMPETVLMSELPVRVCGSKAKVESQWLLVCAACGRRFLIGVYLK